MLSLDIPLLRSFVAVARNHSIKTAANVIGRTQSALSMQIKRLEDIVGQSLIHRERYGVELTAAGERLLVHALNILEQHDRALSDITGNGLHGLVSIGCPEEYLSTYFPKLLREFNLKNPQVEVEIVSAPTTELRGLLRQNRVDLALISLPDGSDSTTLITTEQFVWVANHPTPSPLKREVLPLALSAPNTLEHRAAREVIEKHQINYRIAFASNSFAALLAMTRSGQAISVMTQSAIPDDLHILTTQLPKLPQIGVHLSYASAKPSQLVKTCGEFIRTYLSSSPNPT